MNRIARIVTAACLLSLGADRATADEAGIEPQSWAFPVRLPAAQASGGPADAGVHRLPNSSAHISDAQLQDLFHAVDWQPGSHPTPPAIVVQGHKPDAMACGFCHLPAGQGRPENASLAGLPKDYIIQQVSDMRGGLRRSANPGWGPAGYMQKVAQGVEPDELAEAARYFSGLPFSSHTRVVEARMIPSVEPDGFVYRRLPHRRKVALGWRIVEVPDDFARFELRDATLRYTAYVPTGSIARGRGLASTGGQGLAQPCASCHGEGLKGALGPPLAGRAPTYLFRQLYAFKTGDRHGLQAAPMSAVAAGLSAQDMICLAAYAGSLKP